MVKRLVQQLNSEDENADVHLGLGYYIQHWTCFSD